MNRDIKKRGELIFDAYNPAEHQGGTRHFWWLSLEMLNALITEGFADEQQRQDASPAVGEFRDFMPKHPGYLAHGYAVWSDRTDYRVSIEGLEKPTGFSSQQELDEFPAAFFCRRLLRWQERHRPKLKAPAKNCAHGKKCLCSSSKTKARITRCNHRLSLGNSNIWPPASEERGASPSAPGAGMDHFFARGN